jgi:alpha-D-xyloside xylohydrolase
MNFLFISIFLLVCSHHSHVFASVYHVFPLGTVQLDVFGSGIRVRIAPPGGEIVDATVRALLPTGSVTSKTNTVQSSKLSLTVGDLVATVDSTSGLVSFSRASTNEILFKEINVEWSKPTNSSWKGAVGVNILFSGLVPNERVYGLGEHPFDTQLHPNSGGVGYTSFSSNWSEENNGVLTIPWFASSRGYGFLWNTPAYGSVSISTTSMIWSSVSTLNADFWICSSLANSQRPLADVMSSYVDVVGHAVPMPFSATGFWYSQNRLRNQTQLLDVARGFREQSLPLSVIVIDYLSWDILGDDTFTSICWPDPASMTKELSESNIEVLVSMYPYQNQGSKHYDEFVPTLSAKDLTGAVNSFNGCLQGETIYDAFNPDARAATWNAWQEGYGRYNISWMWQDCSEPGRDLRLNGRWEFSAGTDAEIGPAWTREHARTVAEGAASIGKNASTFVTLSRAAYPGSWMFGTALWSGDVETTFPSLAAQVAVAQQASMSGVALWASDTGGYLGGNASDPQWCELAARWTQFSLFSPIMRFHGKRIGGDHPTECGPTNGVNVPWLYTPDAYLTIAPLLRLRETLREYVAITNLQVVATGLPMIRPLALAFPHDPESFTTYAEATYMFGDIFLVAPITKLGARSAIVWLPRVGSGKMWVDFFDNSTSWQSGGFNITVDAPYPAIDGRFPVFKLVDTVSFSNKFSFSSSPAADLQPLFDISEPWLGADVATSIPLCGGKNDSTFLWLHGDTLVGTFSNGQRNFQSMPRNSVALFHNQNKSSTYTHYIQPADPNNPAHKGFWSPKNSSQWYWPTSGACVDGSLTVLSMRIENGPPGLFPFTEVGYDALFLGPVEALDTNPLNWPVPRELEIPNQNSSFVLGNAVGVDDINQLVYLLGSMGTKNSAYIARIAFADWNLQNWESIEYWSTNGMWEIWGQSLSPAPLFDNCPSETTLVFQPFLQLWYIVVANTFLSNSVGIMTAPSITGPWTQSLTPIYEIPQELLSGAFCYAGKAHPELAKNSNEILFSYVCNTPSIPELLNRTDVYIPQLIRTVISSV